MSFCDEEEREYLFDIEKIIRKLIDVEVDHPYHSQNIEEATKSVARPSNNRSNPRLNSGKRPKHSNHKNKKIVGNNQDSTSRFQNTKPRHSKKSGLKVVNTTQIART